MSISRGSRNLLILGIGTIVLAGISTSVSLAMYRLSGDIYLDRSRPGYLPNPDEAEAESETMTNFTFSDSGPLTANDLGEYLQELQRLNDRLKAFDDPYSPEPLSDSSLGIPNELPEE